MLRSTLIIIASQFALFLIPLMMFNTRLVLTLFMIVNALIIWYSEKQVEKKYYKKYNKFASMLYNSTPLLAIFILLCITYLIDKDMVILFLLKYYFITYIIVLIINLFYILINLKSSR